MSVPVERGKSELVAVNPMGEGFTGPWGEPEGMKKYFGPERRKYLRINARYVVNYHISSKKGEQYDLTQTKDISQGGLIITTDREFNQGGQIELTVRLPFITGNVEISGEIVDSKRIKKTALYETRIKFISLSRETYEKLGEFIERRRGKQNE